MTFNHSLVSLPLLSGIFSHFLNCCCGAGAARQMLLLLSGDVETNPGPVQSSPVHYRLHSFPTRRSSDLNIELLANELTEGASSGFVNPLEFLVKIEFLTKVLEQAKKQVKEIGRAHV